MELFNKPFNKSYVFDKFLDFFEELVKFYECFELFDKLSGYSKIPGSIWVLLIADLLNLLFKSSTISGT